MQINNVFILAEDLHITNGLSREDKYQELIPQIRALVADEPDLIANLANIAAAIRETFGFLWVGFYVVQGNELVLGPFQGPVACTRISKGKGVCGKSWAENSTIIVPDVERFPGHIACSSRSRSEIVLPVSNENDVCMVLDIDSEHLNDFSEIDERYLKEVIVLIERLSR